MNKIIIQKDYIPITFEDEKGNLALEIQFDKSDENIEKFYQEWEKYQAAEGDDDVLKNNKDALKHVIDKAIGAGTFDKLYSLNPSIIIVTSYFVQIVDIILKDIQKDTQSEAIDRYLNG